MTNYCSIFFIVFILIGINFASAQIGSFIDVRTDNDTYNLEDIITVSGDANSNIPFNPKVSMTRLTVVNDQNKPIPSFSVGQVSKIALGLKNLQNIEQDYLYLLQIQDKTGDIVSLSWVSGTLDPQQTFESALTWIPKASGTYFAKILIWDSTTNAEPLTALKTYKLNVGSAPLIQSVDQREYKIAPVSLMIVSSEPNIILVDEIIPTNNEYSKSYLARGPSWNEPENYEIITHQQSQIDSTLFSIVIPTTPPPKPSEQTCGPGTVLEDGVCVMIERGTVEPPVPKPPLGTGEIAIIAIGSTAVVAVVVAAVKGVFSGASAAGGASGTSTSSQAAQGSQSIQQTQSISADVQIRFEVGLE